MTLAAYTAPAGSFPPYFNATRDGDDVVVTVRAAPTAFDGGPGADVMGHAAAMRIPVDEFRRMLADMESAL
jgi:hypothetical protein